MTKHIPSTGENAESFGARLRRLRQQRALRQRDLAGDEVSTSYVSLLESGRRAPTERVARHLAERLGCSPEEFWPPAHPAAARERGRPAEVELRLARIMLLAGRPREAERRLRPLVQDAAADQPMRAEVDFYLAWAAESDGRTDEAAQRYATCLAGAADDYPHRLAAGLGLVRCLARQGMHQRALDLVGQTRQALETAGLAVSDMSVELNVVAAGVYCDRADYDAAGELIGTASAHAASIDDWRRLLKIYAAASTAAYDSGRRGLALELAERVTDVAAGESYARTLALLHAVDGALLLRRTGGETADAETLLQRAYDVLLGAAAELRATGTEQQEMQCRNDLAQTLILLGQPEQAEEHLRVVLDNRWAVPVERARAGLLRATARAATAGPASARGAAEEVFAELAALPVGPASARLFSQLGELLVQVGDPQAAIRAYREALRGVG